MAMMIDAAKVDNTGLGAGEKDLRHGTVFFCGRAVFTRAVGKDTFVVAEGARNGITAVEIIAGNAIASNNGGRLFARYLVLAAVGLGCFSVVESCVLGETHGLWRLQQSSI